MRLARIQKKNHERKRNTCIRKGLFFTVIFAAAVIFGTYNGSEEVHARESSSGQSEHHKYYKSIEVTAGDTLWDIAEEYMDESYDSISEYMNELIEINQLGSGRIHEGRYLTVVYQL